jgi:hypothetical protein
MGGSRSGIQIGSIIPDIDDGFVSLALQQTTPYTSVMPQSNRVAIVTGGGSGFGAGIARKLASCGLHVVVADIASDKQMIEQL